MNDNRISYFGPLATVLLAVATQAVAGTVRIQEDGMDMIALSNRFGSLTVSLRGAQVRSYKPAGIEAGLYAFALFVHIAPIALKERALIHAVASSWSSVSRYSESSVQP